MNKSLVSIIVPIYNVEGYLSQCLDSIIAQTYREWECVLVDDGSKDGSGRICEEYASKDSRFKVIHKPNGGVSSARNIGLEQTKGEWVFFSDADDLLEVDALETLIKGTESGSPFIMAGFNKLSEDKNLIETNTKEIIKEISVEEAIMEQYKPSDFSYQGYLWCKLFRLDIIKDNHLRFDEGISFNEDGLFIMQYICCLKDKVYYSTKPVYNYIERGSSAMGSMTNHFNPKFITHFDSVLKQKESVFAFTSNKRIRKMALKRIATLYIYIHELMSKNGAYNTDLHKEMQHKLCESGAMGGYIKIKIIRLHLPLRRLAKRIIVFLAPGLLKKLQKN